MTCSRCNNTDPNCPVCHEAREPWSEGEAAFNASQPVTSNPYVGTDSEDWEQGWIEAQEKIQHEQQP